VCRHLDIHGGQKSKPISYKSQPTWLDLFVKLKYQSNTKMLSVCIKYSARDLLLGVNNYRGLTCKLAISHIQDGPKNWHPCFVRLFLRLNLIKYWTDFQIYFTLWIRRTFVVILSLKIPPHLKCVATLPCEMAAS